MAPEQADGRPAGPEADVYSLALTLYECWSGENPHLRGDARRDGAGDRLCPAFPGPPAPGAAARSHRGDRRRPGSRSASPPRPRGARHGARGLAGGAGRSGPLSGAPRTPSRSADRSAGLRLCRRRRRSVHPGRPRRCGDDRDRRRRAPLGLRPTADGRRPGAGPSSSRIPRRRRVAVGLAHPGRGTPGSSACSSLRSPCLRHFWSAAATASWRCRRWLRRWAHSAPRRCFRSPLPLPTAAATGRCSPRPASSGWRSPRWCWAAKLIFGLDIQPPSDWQESAGAAFTEVLLPLLAQPAVLAGAAVWVLAAVLAGALLAPLRARADRTGPRPARRSPAPPWQDAAPLGGGGRQATLS